MRRAVIVGGGIAGLTAALRLRQQGIEVRVLEASSRPGGVLASTKVDGFLCEHAANGFVGGQDVAVLELCEELGVELCEASAQARKRWIYRQGRLYELPTNPVAFARSGLLSWRGKLEALRGPLRGAGRQGLDETVGSFARRRFGDEVADNIVEPFVTGIFAGDMDALSFKAAFPELAELDARNGMLRGLVERRLRARRDDGASRSHRLAAPRAGVEALARALAAELGDAVCLGHEVVRVAAEGGRPAAILAGGDRVGADAMVLAVPAHVAAGLLEERSPAFATAARAIPYAPAAVLSLGFDRASIAHPLDGFGFLVTAGSDLRILGCVFESVLWPGRAPEGKVLLRCILGGTRDPSARELPDDELIATASADLDAALGLQSAPVHASVARWSAAIPQYTVGHVERVERAEAEARSLGIVLAGSGYRGVSVNRCVSGATRVAREVLSGLGTALVAALVLLAFAACSGRDGGGKHVESNTQRDGGDAAVGATKPAPPESTTPAGAAPPYVLGKLDADGKLIGGGSVNVLVSWPDPAPELLRPRGANACGVTRAAAVSVHTLHGLRGAVVMLEGVERGIAPAELATSMVAVRDCAPRPRVHVLSRLGATLAIANDDSRRHTLTLEKASDSSVIATLPMPLVGQRYEHALDEPGYYRIAGASIDDDAWVLAPRHPYVRVTDEKGRVSFADVPPGTYQVVAWHPPVAAGQAAMRATGEVTIEAGAAAELTLEPRVP